LQFGELQFGELQLALAVVYCVLMRRRTATHLIATALLALLPAAQAQTKAADELKQIENDWVNALKTKNVARLGEILGDGWVSLDWDGNTTDKAKMLAHLKLPSYTLDSIQMGPMTVRIFENTAVVTGSDTETGKEDGKDASGKYIWTDVFVKQNGKWRAVASQSTKVSK
jgi:ketosteroid isomerase-like protein